MSVDLRRKDNRVSLPRLALTVVVLGVSLLPWLLAADDPAPPQREANRRRFSEMTVTEREQLKENYQVYRQMTAADRDRLRNLQREIDRDPELRAAFEEYQRWADTLTPVERNELRKAEDPAARRKLIERFHRPPPAGEIPEFFPSDRPGDGRPFVQNRDIGRQRTVERLFDGLALPIADGPGTGVAEMEVIIRVLEHELPANQRDELQQLDDYSRQVRVLRLSLERNRMGPPSVRIFGADSELIDKVFAALPEGQFRKLAGNRNFPVNPRPNQSDPRGPMLVMVMVRGLVTETLRTIDDHRPRKDQLMPYLQKLPDAEQTRLRNLPPREFEQEVALLFVKEQVPGIADLQQMLSNPEFRRFLEDFAIRIRPGGGPPADERRDKNGRPGPFEGNRRPRGPDLLPNRPEPKD